MNEAALASWKPMARYWAFAATGLITGPLLAHLFGLVSQRPIILGFPLIAVALLCLSIAFGLWNRNSSAVAKIGIALWVLALAWMSPVILIILFDLNCAVQNSLAGRYQCGL
jgi:hypothetical protein